MARLLTYTFTSLVLSILFAQCSSQKACVPGFKVGPGRRSCYKVFLETKNWDDAQSHCRAWQSNLASISSYEEMEFIWDHIINETFYHYWIGLYKDPADLGSTRVRDAWQWIDGSTYDTSWNIWRRGQPRSRDVFGLLYMSYTGTTDPYWTGERSGIGRHTFICEHSLEVSSAQPSTTSTASTSSSTTQTSSTTTLTAKSTASTSTPSTTTTTVTTNSPTTAQSSLTTKWQDRSSTTLTASKITVSSTRTSNTIYHGVTGVKALSAGIASDVKTAIGLGVGFAILILPLLVLFIYCMRKKPSPQPETGFDEVGSYGVPSYLTLKDVENSSTAHLYDNQTYEYIN